MNFAQIPAGAAIFIDANVLIYHFINDPKYGAACTQLIKRVELGQVGGFTSAHILTDVAHRLMTLEAMQRLNWPPTGLAVRLRKHHAPLYREDRGWHRFSPIAPPRGHSLPIDMPAARGQGKVRCPLFHFTEQPFLMNSPFRAANRRTQPSVVEFIYQRYHRLRC